jgi:hypothetical protein
MLYLDSILRCSPPIPTSKKLFGPKFNFKELMSYFITKVYVID